MRWKYLLIDNDNTIMDFNTAEKLSLKETLQDHGLPDDENVLSRYRSINQQVWEAHERGEISQEELVVKRFAVLLGELGQAGMDSARINDDYENRLALHPEVLPGAVELLNALKDQGIRIALVTNGVSHIQRSRLSLCSFAHLLDAVAISGELGYSKPDRRLVETALHMLGCENPKEAVFLGDSLTADIAAARNAGIDSIWLSPSGAKSPLPTYTVQTFAEAEALILADMDAQDQEGFGG